MTAPYYDADGITLYFGDCREVTEWLAADVLVTDPPYGIKWSGQGYNGARKHAGIANDEGTAARDYVVAAMRGKPALLFGSAVMPPPEGTKQALAWAKPADAGIFGAMAGWRRDWEPVYLVGPWRQAPASRSGVIQTSGSLTAYVNGDHPHAKPVGLMEQLIAACPPGVIADPFAGSGSTLVAARNQGRRAVGVEVEERYCDLIATRLAQGDLFGGAA